MGSKEIMLLGSTDHPGDLGDDSLMTNQPVEAPADTSLLKFSVLANHVIDHVIVGIVISSIL